MFGTHWECTIFDSSDMAKHDGILGCLAASFHDELMMCTLKKCQGCFGLVT